jgi:hypothetical protein
VGWGGVGWGGVGWGGVRVSCALHWVAPAPFLFASLCVCVDAVSFSIVGPCLAALSLVSAFLWQQLLSSRVGSEVMTLLLDAAVTPVNLPTFVALRRLKERAVMLRSR